MNALSWIRLFAICFFLAASATAAEKSGSQKIMPPPASDLTGGQQERILKAFGIAVPELQTFAINFPSAKFAILRAKPNSLEITIATAGNLGKFSFSLILEATFESDFSALRKINSVLFGAYDNRQEMKPNAARAPLVLDIHDMEKFCANPYTFLEVKFAETAKR